MSTGSHIQHSGTHREQAPSARSPKTHTFFRATPRPADSAELAWCDRRALTCRSLGLRRTELEGERQDQSLGAGHGAPPSAPGPARGAPPEPEPSPSRARAGAKQHSAERDWRRVQSRSPSKRGADVRPGRGFRGLGAPPAGSLACCRRIGPPTAPARPSPTPAPRAWRSEAGPRHHPRCTELAPTFPSELAHCPRLPLTQRPQGQRPKDTLGPV